ncbi:MAG TPA: ABC transporter substrate-binding protein [Candidatus Sulfomarinibacteraceae bacterium]|nr:ABC transporter substrate-binding protein [Candidatus Sulfomarinibacteraceae bacterium]
MTERRRARATGDSPERIVRSTAAARAVALLAAALTALAVEATQLTDAERRGKELYLTGRSPSGGEVTAVMGPDRILLPGRAAACGGCHGHDGTGRPESGIIPSNVTWDYLTKSYGHVHEDGLVHGPFDDDSLTHYMRTGVYPGGATGDSSMPLYDMPPADLEDLIAYLKRIGDDVDPGVGDSSVTVATVVPSAGPLVDMGRTIRDVLAASFERVNSEGGIYGREIVFEVHELAADPAVAQGLFATWLAARQPFALVSPFTPGIEPEVNGAARDERVPVIGPWTLYPVESYTLNRSVFYLVSGLAEQVRAIIGFLAPQLEGDGIRAAVLYPDVRSVEGTVASIEGACRDVGWTVVESRPFALTAGDPGATVGALRDAGADVVISLASETELRAVLGAADAAGWTPWVLAPGVLTGALAVDAPAAFRGRLVLAYPTLPPDREEWALRDLSRIVGGGAAVRDHVQAAISASAAAAVLTEGLRRAGRRLGRTELLSALESLYRFETGLTPPLTYTPNRRVGANGAWVVVDDGEQGDARALLETARWVELP